VNKKSAMGNKSSRLSIIGGYATKSKKIDNNQDTVSARVFDQLLQLKILDKEAGKA
jgi:hypothetical protein